MAQYMTKMARNGLYASFQISFEEHVDQIQILFIKYSISENSSLTLKALCMYL